MSKRFDNRSKEEFKKDIKFGTMIENFWMKRTIDSIKSSGIYPDVFSYRENGVGNDGEFVTKSNGNADFVLVRELEPTDIVPLEIKWCPTKGKISLKLHDLKGYINQGADILLIYNNDTKTLKQPNHTDYNKHWKLINSNIQNIKWAIITCEQIQKMINDQPIVSIHYMGNKEGIILKESEFNKYFILNNFV